MRNRKIVGLLLLLMPLSVFAQKIDTAAVLRQLTEHVKGLADLSYDYNMDITFPNGEKDNLKGVIYLNAADKVYYNECSAFTMIYSGHWFYKADHIQKTLTIIDANKDRKGKKAREAELFRNDAVTTFLDSFLLKKSTIQKYVHNGNMIDISLRFPTTASVRSMDILYNTASDVLQSCYVTTSQPWQRTANGIQTLDMKVRFSNFQKITDKQKYSEEKFFTYENRKIELKKYNNYKLSTKI